MAGRHSLHTEFLGIYITPEAKADLVQASKESGMSLSWHVRECLKAHYGKRDGGPAPTKPVALMPRPRGA
ncbi:hypothetical protein SAMN05444149_1018 [Pseudosulfitobacter pseudonitzschiae]|uniref:Ribbon-helix-helix protein CopG domain-containing protein n=1 Tax=Pseudosulfitobacter pseudonitzschiae TaxID=1402135 RepID=A0A073J8I3_9RHOB|nr:CopG family transcriptional regulator [Pseudosulfitobacter pseudonitzschiae]KEJ98274.1 hypothetical protein SUH3_04570 [Pseudosulfitobacter pseudonitzschiae]SHE40459.1 hypothetical protein SAMN05444149_1018 [Pseudosulfitobacter pseudonitzschiae]